MAAVIPTMVLSFWQSFTIVWPKTSCQFGAAPGFAGKVAPVANHKSKAVEFFGVFSAASKPLPFLVKT